MSRPRCGHWLQVFWWVDRHERFEVIMNGIHNAPAASHSLYGRSDRWFLLTLVALNYFTIYLHRNLLNYVQIPLQEGLDLTETQIGWLRPSPHSSRYGL